VVARGEGARPGGEAMPTAEEEGGHFFGGYGEKDWLYLHKTLIKYPLCLRLTLSAIVKAATSSLARGAPISGMHGSISRLVVWPLGSNLPPSLPRLLPPSAISR